MCWGVSASRDLGEEPQEPQSMTKYSEVKRERDRGQTELNNTLVKKNVLNEINQKGTFMQDLKDCRKIKIKYLKI